MATTNEIEAKGRGLRKQLKKTFGTLRALSQAQQDDLIHREHEAAFRGIDCLDCGNCCKTAGPRIASKDIARMAKGLKISESEVVDSYLKVDPEDGEYIMKALPCPFLADDNYCSIYDFRPKACREYPHTDRRRQHQLHDLHKKNLLVCPAVQQMFERIESRI